MSTEQVEIMDVPTGQNKLKGEPEKASALYDLRPTSICWTFKGYLPGIK